MQIVSQAQIHTIIFQFNPMVLLNCCKGKIESLEICDVNLSYFMDHSIN